MSLPRPFFKSTKSHFKLSDDALITEDSSAASPMTARSGGVARVPRVLKTDTQDDVDMLKNYVIHHINEFKKSPDGIPLNFSEKLLDDLQLNRNWNWETRNHLFNKDDEFNNFEAEIGMDSSPRKTAAMVGSPFSNTSPRTNVATPASNRFGLTGRSGGRTTRSTKSFGGPSFHNNWSDSDFDGSEDIDDNVHEVRRSTQLTSENDRVDGLEELPRASLIPIMNSKEHIKAVHPARSYKHTTNLNGYFDIQLPDGYLDKLIFVEERENNARYVNVRWPVPFIHAVYNFKEAICKNKLEPNEWSMRPLDQETNELKFKDATGKEVSRTIKDLFLDIIHTAQRSKQLYWLDTTAVGFTPNEFRPDLKQRRPFIYYLYKSIRAMKGSVSFENLAFNDPCREMYVVNLLIFNVLQTVAILERGEELSEKFHHYGIQSQPRMPSCVFADLILRSNDFFQKECILEVYHIGRQKNLDPWGIRIRDEDNKEIRLERKQLIVENGEEGKRAKVPPEEWEKIKPGSKLKIFLAGEHGSSSCRFGKSIYSKVIKPKSETIKLKNHKDPVCFAETFGDDSKMHYWYKGPIKVEAEKGNKIIIYSKNDPKKRIVANTDKIDNLDKWIFENCEDATGGRGGIAYFTGGRLDKEKGIIVGRKFWDHKVNKFMIEQETGTDKKLVLEILNRQANNNATRVIEEVIMPKPEENEEALSPMHNIDFDIRYKPWGGAIKGKGGGWTTQNQPGKAHNAGIDGNLSGSAKEIERKRRLNFESSDLDHLKFGSGNGAFYYMPHRTDAEGNPELDDFDDPIRMDRGTATPINEKLPYEGKDLIYTDNNGKKWVNIRYPADFIHNLFQMMMLVIDNDLKPEDWFDKPLKDISGSYKFRSFFGGNEGGPFGKYLSLFNKGTPTDYTLWWLDNKKIGAWNGDGKQDRKYLQKMFRSSINIAMGRADSRPLNAPSFSFLTEAMYNGCQVIALLLSGKVDETIFDYQVTSIPPQPDVICIDLIISSDTEYASDLKVAPTVLGSKADISPWGITVTVDDDETFAPIVLSSKDLKNPTLGCRVGWERWRSVPASKWFTVTLVPEEGSPAYSGGNITQKAMKPISKPIDFTLSEIEEKYQDIVFAETLGDGNGIYHHYRMPLRLYAQKFHVLAIKNLENERQKIIPMEECRDVDMWLFENTQDRGTGWSGLMYLGGGEKDEKVTERNKDEYHRLRNVRCWDGFKARFAICQIEKVRKAKPAEESGAGIAATAQDGSDDEFEAPKEEPEPAADGTISTQVTGLLETEKAPDMTASAIPETIKEEPEEPKEPPKMEGAE